MFNNKGGLGQGGFGQGGFGGGFGGNDSMAAPGGGFLTSPGKSPMTSTQADRKKVVQNMMPVTVSQVLNTPEGEEHLKVGSLAAHMITLVGMVTNVDEQTTRITYKVDDMTAPPLEVQLWMGDNDETNAENRSKIMENTYVRVLGTIRMVKNQRIVSAFRVLPVLDKNEISMHMLEVVHTHMAIAAMDKEAPEEKMDTSMTFGGGMTFDKNTNMNMQQSHSMDNSLGLNKQQNMVYQAIMNVHTADGISKDTLCGFLKTLPRSTIDEHLRFLCNEGHIYSTIDEEHYKTIDSM